MSGRLIPNNPRMPVSSIIRRSPIRAVRARMGMKIYLDRSAVGPDRRAGRYLRRRAAGAHLQSIFAAGDLGR
jgi:hypothetical protein